MTVQPDRPDPWESERRRLVADEVYSWMGRRRTNQAALAAAMGKSEMYLSRRLNGKIPFSTDDLFRLADLLDVSASVFLHVERGDAAMRQLSPAPATVASPGHSATGARPTPLRKRRGETTHSSFRSFGAFGVAA
jgi:transcriptional regulator with XRE-family HTH domain